MTEMPTYISYLLAWYVAVSVITYATYAWDKRAAIKKRQRVSEKTLHWLALLGGWPGAWCAQQQLRHKTQKTSFRRVYWATVLLNIAVLGGLVAVMPLR
ncbi:DUF1294 domain-containing protein [Vreelandella aquamarina]|uniref:Cold-shock protein n=1 Tax=Vreelandella aquamarina TaxID=77097 RepID=A0A6F8SVE3_9GAMM|nr:MULTISPECIES: DUF1294 domain-containing protein [Halomonas]BCA92139.1 hypothetical protein HMSLTHF_19140 [Halomonas meridiana]